jgi:hypothetical protein
MKNRLAFLLLMFVLAAAGCQGNPQVRRVVDSYNAENRQLEDYIYLLEQDIQVLEQENGQLRRRIEGGGAANGAGSSAPRRGGLIPRGGGRNSEQNPPEIEGPPEIEMPETLPRTRPEAPRPLNKPAVQDEPDIGPLLEKPANSAKKPPAEARPAHAEIPVAELTKSEPEVTDKKVTHIQLSPLHTCGMDFDHAPGDDGVSILIEPRNAANQFVPLAGPVSVVVLDPNKNGDDARIARWDFSQEQSAEKLAQGASRGIHLKLPWPTKPPESARLEVFVRYATPEGQKLQADKEILVALPGQFSQRWTPRAADGQRKSRMEASVAKANERRVAVVPPAPAPLESPAEKPVAEEAPALITPPAGLSERQAGEKPARPKWGPTR